MNPSIRLASFIGMYSPISNSGTVPAIRTENSEASKSVMGVIPLLPSSMLDQLSSTLQPRGDNIPNPVTTTLLLLTTPLHERTQIRYHAETVAIPQIQRPHPFSNECGLHHPVITLTVQRCLGVRVDIVDRFFHRGDLFCFLIWNLSLKLFF